MIGSGMQDDPDSSADSPCAAHRPPRLRPAASRLPAPPEMPVCTEGQRAFLLGLARKTVESVVHQEPMVAPEPCDLDSALLERRACFVTLEKRSNLRGCIGHLLPHRPLYAAVIEAARQAATADPRFARVQPEELSEITIEISVLSTPRLLGFGTVTELLDQIKPFRHGVVLQFEERTATFLPQVWEQMPEKLDFMERLALKGGWERGIWRDPRARISVYEVEWFRETTRSG